MSNTNAKPSRAFSRVALVALAVLASCIQVEDKGDKKTASADSSAILTMPADSSDVSFPSYEAYSSDTAGAGQRDSAFAQFDSSFAQAVGKAATTKLSKFPVNISGASASALQVQILLDRAHFSPGIIDGRWGDNARKAFQWFKASATGDTTSVAAAANTANGPTSLDQATYQRLASAAGSAPLLTQYTVTQEDVQGPFTKIPDNVYEQAKLQCLCYTSAAEELAEKFHTSEKLLAQLNPNVQFASIAAGAAITVPNVGENVSGQVANASAPLPTDTGITGASGSTKRTSSTKSARGKAGASGTSGASGPSGASGASGSSGYANNSASAGSVGAPPTGQVAKLVVSRKDFWTHAVDASGRVIAHYPSTLGAGYDPSPSGDFRITNISQNPAFHYQPTLFAEVSDKKPEAHLPKGPNSPVGVVWMALSKPHYGIHGTSTPQTIGYASSHGCVRLTNWDAQELSHLVQSGTPVVFQ